MGILKFIVPISTRILKNFQNFSNKVANASASFKKNLQGYLKIQELTKRNILTLTLNINSQLD